MYRIFMVEVRDNRRENARWIPMYQPCYSHNEANLKARHYSAKLGLQFETRVAEYIRGEFSEPINK